MDSLVPLCAAADLVDGGDAVPFDVVFAGQTMRAFAIRFEGQVHAYLNRCPHVPAELDWDPGRFFDMQGLLLICSNHGAIFLPESGRCIGGPCKGRNLVALPVEERDGKVILKESGHGGRR